MIDRYLEMLFLHLELIRVLALYLFSDYRWAWFIFFAFVFDVFVTLPVTLFLRSRLKEPT